MIRLLRSAALVVGAGEKHRSHVWRLANEVIRGGNHLCFQVQTIERHDHTTKVAKLLRQTCKFVRVVPRADKPDDRDALRQCKHTRVVAAGDDKTTGRNAIDELRRRLNRRVVRAQ